MPRRVQDIVPGDRRSIRDVPLKENAPRTRQTREIKEQSSEREYEIPIHRSEPALVEKMPITPREAPREARPPSRLKWLLIAIAIIVVVAVIAYVASAYFAQASFTIIPKTISIPVSGTYVAQPTPESGSLSYSLTTLQRTASSSVPATDGPETSAKAQGRVTVYNAFSKEPQRLIAGTRLSNDSGLVYRLTSSIVIPGFTKPNASVIPGSVSATIVAGEPGASYNMSRSDPQSDFKIVAYKGTGKYDSIYARLSSEVTGGYTGTKKVISAAAMASTTTALKASITSSLLAEARSSIPEGYIMYDNGYTTVFSEPLVGGDEPKSATVSIKGTLYGILFKKSDLVDTFAEGKSASAFGSFGYRSNGLEALAFKITNLRDFGPSKKTALVIQAAGNLKLVGNIPIDEIQAKLAGIPLAGTQNVFKSYPVIESGSGELMPPWANIPTDPKRIRISVQGE